MNQQDKANSAELTYDQVLNLLKRRPLSEKIALAKELENETFVVRFEKLLQSLKASEISDKEITQEVEAVRANRFSKQQV